MNILAILQLVPVIISTIKAIEEAIPGSGNGEKKLSAVRSILEIADATISSNWEKISGVVSVLVKLLNDTGVFKKG